MSSFLGYEQDVHEAFSTSGISYGTGSSGVGGSTLPAASTASSNFDESTTTVSTHHPKGESTEPTGPPRHPNTFGRTGGVTGLWRSYDPNHPTSGGYSRTAKQSISSSPKEPEPAVVEEQATPKNGQQS